MHNVFTPNLGLLQTDISNHHIFGSFPAGVVSESPGQMEKKRTLWSDAAGPNTLLNSIWASSSYTTRKLCTGKRKICTTDHRFLFIHKCSWLSLEITVWCLFLKKMHMMCSWISWAVVLFPNELMFLNETVEWIVQWLTHKAMYPFE